MSYGHVSKTSQPFGDKFKGVSLPASQYFVLGAVFYYVFLGLSFFSFQDDPGVLRRSSVLLVACEKGQFKRYDQKKEISVEPQPSFSFTTTVIFLGLCKVVNFCTGQTYVSTVIYLCYLNQTSGTLTRVIYKCGYCFPTLKEYDYITLVKVLLILT